MWQVGRLNSTCLGCAVALVQVLVYKATRFFRTLARVSGHERARAWLPRWGVSIIYFVEAVCSLCSHVPLFKVLMGPILGRDLQRLHSFVRVVWLTSQCFQEGTSGLPGGCLVRKFSLRSGSELRPYRPSGGWSVFFLCGNQTRYEFVQLGWRQNNSFFHRASRSPFADLSSGGTRRAFKSHGCSLSRRVTLS